MCVGVLGGGVLGAVAEHAPDLVLGGSDARLRGGGEHDRCRGGRVDTGGGGAAGLFLLAGCGGGVQDSRRNRLCRKAPGGLVMWSGQVTPRARMSASRASVMARAVQTEGGSILAAVSASQMVPMWARSRPRVRETSSAARRWTVSGRGEVRLGGRAVRVLDPFLCHLLGGRACAPAW